MKSFMFHLIWVSEYILQIAGSRLMKRISPQLQTTQTFPADLKRSSHWSFIGGSKVVFRPRKTVEPSLSRKSSKIHASCNLLRHASLGVWFILSSKHVRWKLMIMECLLQGLQLLKLLAMLLHLGQCQFCHSTRWWWWLLRPNWYHFFSLILWFMIS